MWINCQGGLFVLEACFWHTEGWTPRNEAIMEAILKSAASSVSPWIMEPEELRQEERETDGQRHHGMKSSINEAKEQADSSNKETRGPADSSKEEAKEDAKGVH